MYGLLTPISRLRDFFVEKAPSEPRLPQGDSKQRGRDQKKKRDESRESSPETAVEETPLHNIDVLA